MSKKANSKDQVQKKSNDWMLKPRRAKVAIRDGQFAPFEKIIRTYRELPEIEPPAKAYKLTELVRELCPSARLAMNSSGRPVPWKEGQSSLCNPESPGALGRAASEHALALAGLYKRWTQLEDDPNAVGMYQRKPRTNRSDLQDAQIMPFLPIYRREYLSLEYVTGVLTPYAQAVYECRQIFWERLQEGHCHGAWLCFRPDENGFFNLLTPGVGFDGQGNYEIDRATYLSAFGFGEDEIPVGNYPHTSPRAGQGRWMFVGIDEVLKLPPEQQNKPGRKKGTGHNDERFVQMGLDLIANGEVSNAHAAAKFVLKKYEREIKGASYDAKLDRIYRKIRARSKP